MKGNVTTLIYSFMIVLIFLEGFDEAGVLERVQHGLQRKSVFFFSMIWKFISDHWQ